MWVIFSLALTNEQKLWSGEKKKPKTEYKRQVKKQLVEKANAVAVLEMKKKKNWENYQPPDKIAEQKKTWMRQDTSPPDLGDLPVLM